MKFTVTTPLAIVADIDGVAHVRAEDETGAFGILQGHADFLTALTLSVVSWRVADGGEHHVAARGGMLQVHGGNAVTVATREAVVSDDLEHLETEVLAAFRRNVDEEHAARTDSQRLYLAAIRQISRLVDERGAFAQGGAPAFRGKGS